MRLPCPCEGEHTRMMSQLVSCPPLTPVGSLLIEGMHAHAACAISMMKVPLSTATARGRARPQSMQHRQYRQRRPYHLRRCGEACIGMQDLCFGVWLALTNCTERHGTSYW